MDRLEAMSVLLAVVQEGSLSAGARRLNSSLPTISRKVAELERYLGTQLLIRTARRVELTEAGQAFVTTSKKVIELVEEAERAAAGEYLAPRGELSITAPVLFGRRHVLPVAAEFLEAYPDISLQLHLADKNISIAHEHVHVAVRIGELTDNMFMATNVGTVRRVVCASPSYFARRGRPHSPADLRQHEAITIAGFGDPLVWMLRIGGQNTAVNVRPRCAVNLAEGALDAALAGLGIAQLLSYQVSDALRSGELVEVLEEFAPVPVPVSLTYPAQTVLPLKVRAFLNWSAPRLRARLG